MSNNFRNADLLQKVGRNPLKATLAKALDIAEAFADDVQFLSLNKDLSPVGRDNALSLAFADVDGNQHVVMQATEAQDQSSSDHQIQLATHAPPRRCISP